MRIVELDALRGFALVGVVWMNLVEFSLFVAPASITSQLPTASVDGPLTMALVWLVMGKAQTVFGILFGMGYAIFAGRLARRGDRHLVPYLRRVAGLFLFGLLNMLLFFGDILHDYAITALVAMVLVATAPRLLAPLGMALLLFSHAVATLAGDRFGPWGAASTTPMALSRDLYAAFTSGQIQRLWEVSREFVWVRSGSFAGLGSRATILGQALTGYWLVRSGRFQALLDAPKRLRRISWIAIPSGLIASAAALWIQHGGASVPAVSGDLLSSCADAVLALGYGTALIGVSRRHPGLAALAAAYGRMALTNYLSQSVLIAVFVSDIGFGAVHRMGALELTGVALVFAAFQAVASAAWLSRFEFGPAEWLWRCLTYLAWFPIQRRPAEDRSSAC